MATSGYSERLVEQALWAATYLTFSWERTSYSIKDNTSTILWELRFKGVNGGHNAFTSNDTYVVVVNGVTYTGLANTELGLNENKVLASGKTVISHNADGNKTFSFSYQQNFTMFSAFTVSNSGTGTLDTIPRAATIVSAVDFTDEENPTITYNNTSGNLVTSLEACISFTGATDDVPYREISKTGTSYTFNLTNDERAALWRGVETGNSRTVRFYIKTTIGNETFWNYLTKTLSLVNYKPTLSPTITDTNPTTAMLTGDINKIVRYYSNANIVFGAWAHKGATIRGKIAANGKQTVGAYLSTQDSVVINNVEDNVFTLTATDSREHATTQQVHFKGDNFIPYFDVTCHQTIHLNLDQTIEMTVKGNYYNGSFGAKDNILTIQTRRREDGGEWTAWENITPLLSDMSNGTYTLNATLSGYDPSGTYEFQCRASDMLSVAESAIETITLKPIFDWGKNDFNFNVPLTIEGDSLADFVIETGTASMGTNGTWYWRKWKSGRADCYGCRNFGNMGVTTTWGGLYRSVTNVQAYPRGLFVATPDVIDISLRGTSNYGGWIVRHEEMWADEIDTGSFIVVRPASATIQQVYISFNIIGRWK